VRAAVDRSIAGAETSPSAREGAEHVQFLIAASRESFAAWFDVRLNGHAAVYFRARRSR
jgi:hypothetical protein